VAPERIRRSFALSVSMGATAYTPLFTFCVGRRTASVVPAFLR
jgi:hypothetical protein